MLKYSTIKKIGLILVACALVGCGTQDGEVFTLYRNFTLNKDSKVGADARIHVATFDSTDGEAYNRENCEIARVLFQQQPMVVAKYWCEKGRYKK